MLSLEFLIVCLFQKIKTSVQWTGKFTAFKTIIRQICEYFHFCSSQVIPISSKINCPTYDELGEILTRCFQLLYKTLQENKN